MYKIGELATLCNVNNDTLRYYEKSGLLIPSSRSEAGYRLYNEQDKQVLLFILRAKKVGFNLAEIADLLSIDVDKASSSCADVKQKVDDKRIEVERKIAELQSFNDSLQRLSNACCGGERSAEYCTILQALETDIEQIQSEQHCKE